MKKVSWFSTLGGVLVIAVACGNDRAGGGGSETHWMDPCVLDKECGTGLRCECGICTVACETTSDCNAVDTPASCAPRESVPSCERAPASSGICVTAIPGVGGAGGTGDQPSTPAGASGEPSSGVGGATGGTGPGGGGSGTGGTSSGGQPPLGSAGEGGGGVAGAAGVDGSAGAPLLGLDGDGRVFYDIPSTDARPGLCSDSEPCPTSSTCFALTDDFGVCDLAQPEAATACTSAGSLTPGEADECGCDGLACGEGQTCVSIEQTCSCAPAYHNACVESACASTSDCPDGTVCTPSSYIFESNARCLTPACTRDADCAADGPGRCAMLLGPPLQGGETYLRGVVCIYAGDAADPESCAGALTAWPDGHTCPE